MEGNVPDCYEANFINSDRNAMGLCHDAVGIGRVFRFTFG